jgi:hypothetical protein
VVTYDDLEIFVLNLDPDFCSSFGVPHRASKKVFVHEM